MILKTKRLILRPVQRKDISDIVENINNIRVTRWLLVVPYPYARKDAGVWIKSQRKAEKEKPSERKNYQFGIELREESRVIGGIGLHKVDRVQGKAEVGYWLGQNYWRNGYGSEALKAMLDFAFKKLRLRKVEAGVFKGNPSSGKLLEKYGFRKEGLKRKACVCKADGRIRDEYMYGLLRNEYKPRRK